MEWEAAVGDTNSPCSKRGGVGGDAADPPTIPQLKPGYKTQ